MKGYAGTGKTTLVGTLVASLWKSTMKAVLMAPTGRAAKVMANYSNTLAYTIHRKIYFPQKAKWGEECNSFWLQTSTGILYLIVDEASMISDSAADSKLFENGSLLDDLLLFVYSGHNCKILLIGGYSPITTSKFAVKPCFR